MLEIFFVADAYPRKFFSKEVIFISPLLRMGAARLLDYTTAKTTNGRVMKSELLFAVMIFIRRFWMRKLESKCSSGRRGSKTFIQGSIKHTGRTTRAK